MGKNFEIFNVYIYLTIHFKTMLLKNTWDIIVKTRSEHTK